MRIKTTFILSLAISAITLSIADYTIKYSLDKDSLHFVDNSNINSWFKTSPTFTDWEYSGEYINCSGYNPLPEKYATTEKFSQEVSKCSRESIRYKQEREQNNKTLAYRNIGSPIKESKIDKDLTYTREINGTDVRFTVNYGAGRMYYNNSSTYVGAYARKNLNIDIGTKVFNEHGHRILAYFSKTGAYNTSGDCGFRIGATNPEGWTLGSVPVGAIEYLNQINYVSLYNADGSLYKKYHYTNTDSTFSDGAHKTLSVPCTDLSRFYTNLNIYSKAVLSKY